MNGFSLPVQDYEIVINRGDGRSVKHAWKLGQRAVRQHDHESKDINLFFIYVSEQSATIRVQTNKRNVIKSK